MRRGFTLIELMSTPPIVGILASIAIPEYSQFTLRTKRAELTMNLDAIRSNQIGYHAEWDVFTSCQLSPEEVPGRVAVDFPATIFTSLDWNQVGWTPDGRVYGQYEVIANEDFGFEATFIGNVYADIDGDGNLSHYQTTQLLKPVMLTSNTIY